MKRKKYSKNASFEKVNNTPKKSKKGIVIVSIIIFLMVFSVIASIFFYRDPQNETNPNVYTYKDKEFKLIQNGWEYDNNGNKIIFDYLPQDLLDIETNMEQSSVNTADKYVIFDPADLSKDSFEIYKFRVLNMQNGEVYYPACISEENCGDLPIKECISGNVYLKIGDSNSIKQENECIILESTTQDMIKVINKFMYTKLGII